jgi:hypothetical protein
MRTITVSVQNYWSCVSRGLSPRRTDWPLSLHLDLNKDQPGLERVLKHKWRLRKLRQVTRNPACKTAVSWVAKIIGRMSHRKARERWEKIGNCEVTLQALWPIAKSLMKSDGPKARTAAHRHLGITYHPTEKTNVIADCLE